jgi:transposase
MAPKAKGQSVLEIAKSLMAKAMTANELRICQAVIFPLEYGMTTRQTASCIGRSVGWTTRNRNAFIKAGGFVKNPRPGGRKRANMTVGEEKDFLEPFLEKARVGGILVAGDIHRALEERLGRKVALASAYNLLHRHNWRKLAPDKRHVNADLEAQADWEKNSPNS